MLASTIFLTLASMAFASPVQKADLSVVARQAFKGGWCGIHVHGVKGLGNDNAGYKRAYIRIYDGEQWLLYESDWESVDKGVLQLEGQAGGLPETLYTQFMPDGDKGAVAKFSYGDYRWTSDDSQCSVGGWDKTGLSPTNAHIDMDCGFSC